MSRVALLPSVIDEPKTPVRMCGGVDETGENISCSGSFARLQEMTCQ